jgi:hypothetical protein
LSEIRDIYSCISFSTDVEITLSQAGKFTEKGNESVVVILSDGFIVVLVAPESLAKANLYHICFTPPGLSK